MTFSATVIEVFIASPGDAKEERSAVEQALAAWNLDRARREHVIVLPRRWESSAVPRFNRSGGQEVINSQLVDRADIVVAFFDSRLGRATAAAVSGTAEEIERARAAGIPVHVWFSDEPLPRDADLEQVAALRSYQKRLQAEGLQGSYASPDDLGSKARQALEGDLDLIGEAGPLPAPGGARLRAAFIRKSDLWTDRTGRRNQRTTTKLVVTNTGSKSAEGVKLEMTSMQVGAEVPMLVDENVTPTIIPDSDFAWTVVAHGGTANAVRLVMTYSEDGSSRAESQDVSTH